MFYLRLMTHTYTLNIDHISNGIWVHVCPSRLYDRTITTKSLYTCVSYDS